MRRSHTPPDADASIGARIRELRKARHLSQEALAERADLQVVVISRAERGRATPSVASLKKVAAALEVPIAALLEPERPEAIPSDDELLARWRRIPDREKALVYDLLGVIARR
jgi:transcriptional regulator with XRE-family HTH domain